MASQVCSNCHWKGQPSRVTPGSFLMEVALWLCFVIPGFLYSMWRITSRHDACPKCGTPNMIPEDTPRGRELLSRAETK